MLLLPALLEKKNTAMFKTILFLSNYVNLTMKEISLRTKFTNFKYTEFYNCFKRKFLYFFSH